jgi:hypothetical protein
MRQESTTTFHLPSSGMPLSPAADAAIAEHVVGGGVLLPGVGYLEMAMASSHGSRPALDAVAFIQPCLLPGLE